MQMCKKDLCVYPPNSNLVNEHDTSKCRCIRKLQETFFLFQQTYCSNTVLQQS